MTWERGTGWEEAPKTLCVLRSLLFSATALSTETCKQPKMPLARVGCSLCPSGSGVSSL